MADRRSRRAKLAAMATQTAQSPHEAAIAARLLADMPADVPAFSAAARMAAGLSGDEAHEMSAIHAMFRRYRESGHQEQRIVVEFGPPGPWHTP